MTFPAPIEKKLRTNFILRMVLVVALACLWLLPTIFNSLNGSPISLGALYAASWTGLLTSSLALVGGIMALYWTKKRIVKDLTGSAKDTPAVAEN